MKLKNKTKTKTKTKYLNKLKGGKYLGEGSYGCVITPPLPCNNKSNTKTKTSSVSKVIINPTEKSKIELQISSLIKKIDPKQDYFITYESYCNLSKIPKSRNNSTSVKYTNSSRKYYYSMNNKTRRIRSTKSNSNNNSQGSNQDSKPNKCLIDLSLKPINIIMPNGGYDLFTIKDEYDENYKNYNRYKSDKYFHFIKTYDMFKQYFKDCFKTLVIGLFKLHTGRIVNRDIKTENIMVNYNKSTDKIDIRYIDFGLSEYLPKEYCTNYDNIRYSGTREVVAPEIFITYLMQKYRYNDMFVKQKKTSMYKYKYTNNDIMYLKNILKDIRDKIDKNVMITLKDYKEYEYIDNMYTITQPTKYNKPIFTKIYEDIKTKFDKKTILNAYFGVNDTNTNTNIYSGYLQKGDVYSLGCAIHEFLYKNSDFINIREQHTLYDLLKKMLHPDPELRYNIIECKNHIYFQ